MRLRVNFPSSVYLKSPGAIYQRAQEQRARELLDEAGHIGRFQIQVSENVPPDSWRTSYPAIVRAIRDFGRG